MKIREMSQKKFGIWLIGARGGVATTAIIGLAGLVKKLTPAYGLVTEQEAFEGLDLTAWDQMVVGGHDIRDTNLIREAAKLAQVSRAFDLSLVQQCEDELTAVDSNIRPGIILNVGKTIEGLSDDGFVKQASCPSEAISLIQSDLKDFQTQHDLAGVVMVNVASTEPTGDLSILPKQWDEFSAELDGPIAASIPASSLYAIAAIDAGFPYVNFTPSVGSELPAIVDLAQKRSVCHMGHDGKTGETLMKSALAPMFSHRNLEIMSWVGHNIFGNMDAVVLDDADNKKTKVTSKDRLLGQILGYSPQTHISIEYIKSMGDWKTAWDHIHFRGFLGTPMTLQFTWQGCDSILAAPLVLDLARLALRAHRFGHIGLMPFLSCFFKSPLGTEENNFERQYQELLKWVERVRVESIDQVPTA